MRNLLPLRRQRGEVDLLDLGEAARVEHLQADAELRRELARLRATVDLVKSLPTLAAPRSFTLTPRTCS